jgi:pimeloyl-ACP methyl ester carboxylesterase
VERVAILNLPHPRQFLHGLRRPRQLMMSWYIFFFQLPRLPERVARARRWWYFRAAWLGTAARVDAFTATDMERYVQAWSQPGAASATINYYRALLRQSPRRGEARIGTVRAPTLVIFGERDRYLSRELAEPERADVPNLERVVRLPQASHWVHHDEPERVNELLLEFLS